MNSSSEEVDILRAPDEEFREGITTCIAKVDRVLPIFMVPTIFIPLNYTPFTKTGKTDRRALGLAASLLKSEEIASFTSTLSSKRAPTTAKEELFRELFSKLFGLDPSLIGVDDHYFRLGGDSILATRLVAMARVQGLAITVAEIFNHPKLCDLAALARTEVAQEDLTVDSFSLLGDIWNTRHITSAAAAQCKVPTTQIEDMYPCTALQEGLVALSNKCPGHYIATFEYDIPTHIDHDRFQRAWERVVLANPIIRTRFVSIDASIFQVVIRETMSWDIYESQEAYYQGVANITRDLGERPIHLGVVRESQGIKFYLTVHHALYDGSTLPLIWTQVQDAYDNKLLPSRPFNGFVKHITQQKYAKKFWQTEFANLSAPIFPAPSSSRHIASPTSSCSYVVAKLKYTATNYTLSTLIRMAWAIIVSAYTDSEDVVFGITVNGMLQIASNLDVRHQS